MSRILTRKKVNSAVTSFAQFVNSVRILYDEDEIVFSIINT